MGLDSYWRKPADKEHTQPPVFEPELRLCGGMLSGHGAGSFRGKVYSDLVERVTGESLYQEVIDNATVCKMADALDKWEPVPEPASIYGRQVQWAYTIEELRDLKRMFRAYADAGYELGGWW